MKLSVWGTAFCPGDSWIIWCPEGNPIRWSARAPRGTNYCFKCHMLTGERPGLHSSFIAALCQMLLSTVSRGRAELRPYIMIMLQCEHTSQGGATVSALWWDTAIDFKRTTLFSCSAFNFCKLTTDSITEWMSSSSITHSSINEENSCWRIFLHNFGLLSSCSVSVWSQWPETALNVSKMNSEIWFMSFT